jgi:hypothetical protein
MTIRWSTVQDVYSANVQEHWTRAQALGLDFPLDVFEQLCFDHHGDDAFGGVVRFVDWGLVKWEERRLSLNAAWAPVIWITSDAQIIEDWQR